MHSEHNLLRLLVLLPLAQAIRVAAPAYEFVALDRAEVAIVLGLLLVAGDLPVSFGVEHDVDLVELVEASLVGAKVLHRVVRAQVELLGVGTDQLPGARVRRTRLEAGHIRVVCTATRCRVRVRVVERVRVPHGVDGIRGVQDPSAGVRYEAEGQSEVAQFLAHPSRHLNVLNIRLRRIIPAYRAVQFDCAVAFKVLLRRPLHFHGEAERLSPFKVDRAHELVMILVTLG